MRRSTVDALMLVSKDYTLDTRVPKEAPALVARGYRVQVLAWDRSASLPAVESIRGFDLIRFLRFSRTGTGMRQLFRFLRFWWWAIRRALAARPRLVHCHDIDTFLPAYVVARRLRIPLVLDAHELYGEMQVGRMPAILVSLLRWFERWAIRRSDATIVVGEPCRAYFASVSNNLVLVGNGWEVVAYDPAARDAVREELGVPPDGFLITFIGTLAATKELQPLIEAVDADPNIYAVVAGTGEQEERIREVAARQPRLRYVGYAKDPHRYMAAADALYYLFRADYNYANYLTGNTVGMAYVHHKPLICDRRGDAGRLAAELGQDLPLREHTGAEVVRVVRALRQPGRLAAIAAKLRADADDSQYSWAASERELAALYARLLGPSSPAAEALTR